MTGSAGAAQVGSAAPAAGAAVNAPATVNAPVTVASPDNGGDASRAGGANAAASTGDDAGSGADQDATGSSGSAQVGAVEPVPSVAANAPATVNAPVTVLSPDSGGDAAQTGDTGASATPGDGGGSRTDQDTSGSSATAQVGSLGLSPAVDAPPPATANAPVTILSPGSGGDSRQTTAVSAPPAGFDDPSDGGTGTVPGAAPPTTGSRGEFVPNEPAAPAMTVARGELGAAAETLPFTGMLAGLLALAGALMLGANATGRWATAA